MSQRFEPILNLLRRLLLAAGFTAGLLYFWLGGHEVFEGPKLHAAAVYGLALLACAWPWLAGRWPALWREHRQALAVGGALVGATALSWLGAWWVLPENLALSLERSLPLLLGALGALVWLASDAGERRGLLFTVQAAHWAVLFYGLLQLLDQTWGQAHGVRFDVIQWARFGESRVYSTLGNPDYMSAHLTLWMCLWLGLGWRGLDPRGPAQAAAGALVLVPLVLLPAVYGTAHLGRILGHMAPWFGLSLGLGLICRRLSARACWVLGLGLLSVLVVVAQGRGAWLAYALAVAAMAFGGWRLQGGAFFRERWAVLRYAAAAALAGALLLAGLWLGRALAPQAAWHGRGAPAKALAVLDSVAYRAVHIFDKASDAQVVRRFYWQAAWRMGLDHPLLGVGYGNHALFTARAQQKVWQAWEDAGDPRVHLVEPHVELYTHNDLLQNFAETGLVGLAAFLLFWGWWLRSAWCLARHGRDSGAPRSLELGLGLIGLAVAFAANALTNFPWRVFATQQLVWLAFAVLALRMARARAAQAASADTPPAPVPIPAATSQAVPPLAWALGLALAGGLALFPLRWSTASQLIKQGNAFKDEPGLPRPEMGVRFYEAAERAGLSGTQQVETLLYLGSLHNQAGRSDQALHWFQQGIRRYPDFLEAWYNVGFTWHRRFEASQDPQHRAQAVAAYQKVLDVNPRAFNALNNLGNLRYQAGELEQALGLYQRLLRFHPSSLEGWYNLAATQVRLGRLKDARSSLERALELKADFGPARHLYGQLKALP